MKSYPLNDLGFDSIHRIMVTIQANQYIGHIYQNCKGNCKGKNILDIFDFECADGTEENDCQLSFNEDLEIFHAVLHDDDGNTLEIDGTDIEFNELMVAVEILSYGKENE